MALLGLCVFLGSFLQQAMAQTFPVTGKVTNKSTGEPMVGASVRVEGTTTSSLTDASGKFSISVQKGATVVVSFAGMTEQKRKVTQEGELVFALEESAASTLGEVVVVGYGTQKITKVSGAIATVKSDAIKKLNPVRLEEALQGGASGVSEVSPALALTR
jgi:hypothetical protein